MSKNLIPATAPVVRAAAREGLFTVPAEAMASVFGADGSGTKVRGRIHPAAQAALVAALPEVYVAVPLSNGNAAPKAQSMVTLDRVSPKTGRPIKSVTLPISEVRALAGKPGSKGRLSKADLLAAAAAHVAANPSKPSGRKTKAEVTEAE